MAYPTILTRATKGSPLTNNDVDDNFVALQKPTNISVTSTGIIGSPVDVPIEPDGTFHIHTASAGTITAHADAKDLVIENSSTVGLSFLSPNNVSNNIFFGNVDDNDVGGIIYSHSANTLTFRANATDALVLGSSTLTLSGNLVLGTQANKATITYATNTTRTLTIPNVSGNRTFSFINQAETFSAVKTFSANPVLSAATATLSFSSTTGNKTISTGGTTDLILSPGRNVGIGTTDPTAYVGYRVLETGDATTQGLYSAKSSVGNALMYCNAGVAYFGSTTAYATAFLTHSAERMRITSTGSVAIGVVSPDAKLTILESGSTPSVSTLADADTLSLDNDGHAGLTIRTPTANYGSIRHATPLDQQSAEIRMDGTNRYMSFHTNVSERMRIDVSGNVTIGQTTTSEQLRVVSSSNSKSAGAFYSNASGDVGQRAVLVSKYDNDSTTSQVFVQFVINNGATASGQINANGANNAAFGSWSDRRLKNNIVTLPSQLDKIMSLRPVEFDFIDTEGGGHQIGFIAQEIQEVYPDVVGVRSSDGMLTVTGWNKTEARLVKAIQEQQAIIEQLKTRLDTISL
jgi:hypothetical protein